MNHRFLVSLNGDMPEQQYKTNRRPMTFQDAINHAPDTGINLPVLCDVITIYERGKIIDVLSKTEVLQ